MGARSENLIPERFIENLNQFVVEMDKYRSEHSEAYDKDLWLAFWQKNKINFDAAVVADVGRMQYCADQVLDKKSPQDTQVANAKFLTEKVIPNLHEEITAYLKAPGLDHGQKKLCEVLERQLVVLRKNLNQFLSAF